MTMFDQRERAFESKFAHDAEVQFRIEAHAIVKLSLTSAQALGLSGANSVSYCKARVTEWLQSSSHEHVCAIIADDLTGAGISTANTAVEAQFAELLAEAKNLLLA